MNKIPGNYRLFFSLISIILLLTSCGFGDKNLGTTKQKESREILFQQALSNGKLANEALVRSNHLMEDWLVNVDKETGLIPRNLFDSKDLWHPKDSGADNYPFFVITSYFTAPDLFANQMQEILVTETALTSRIGRLPDQYSFSKGDFANKEPELNRIMFGSAEYVKDGLITIVELIGVTPWRARMTGILDDMWRHSEVETPSGTIISKNHEINGEMLQVLSRVYWMTGDEKYLEYAIRLGNYYLLGANHPTRNFKQLRLRDHGNEIVSGLTELYATVHHAQPKKAEEYQEPLYEMLDRILEVGRNKDGLFFNVINPTSGEIVDDELSDTWGYLLNGYYTVYLLDGIETYRDAVLKVLNSIADYQDYDWERGSADGDADAIEGALYLYNRETVSSAEAWMDQQVQIMWAKQDSADPRRDANGEWNNSGIVEGWHGDGNFARTSTMYAQWKTEGLHIKSWREDVIYGAVEEDDKLFVTLFSEENWKGRLVFDHPRHRDHLNLPFDWPRINQYCEWFVTEADQEYVIKNMTNEEEKVYGGKELQNGIWVQIEAGKEIQLIVEKSM